MDKEEMIQEIMDMITPLPPEEQEVLCDLIRDVIEDLREMREENKKKTPASAGANSNDSSIP